MDFTNGAGLLELCREHQLPISTVMLHREVVECGAGETEAVERMRYALSIMKDAAARATKEDLHTMGGLIGGESKLLHRALGERPPVCGDVTARAVAIAMGVLEVNASMGLIVAAPTAGASGILPGVLLSLQHHFDLSDDALVRALFNAGAVGYLFTRNATVAGAEGGCQAEVGVASAMAAAATVELMGGTPEQCLDAAATAIGNLLGLVCDPVGGLVEVPCQKRNSIGAANALVSAEITLAGVPGMIPFDEMVDTMYRTGRSIPFELRETSLGGIAATPAACARCPRG